ncbi:carbohydrate ABC transporter permease [Natronospora cellulosivora (SeqCode)]
MKFKFQIRQKQISRSFGGDLFISTILLIAGLITALPLVFMISSAFKPLNELWLFPPQFFVRNPTFQNFIDLFVLMGESWVPMSRYLFNTMVLVVAGTGGHIILASMAAYPLAKHNFYFKPLLFQVIVLSLMFTPQVTAIPNYLTMSTIGWIDNYMALIVPAWAMSLGVFLMRQFMVAMVPDELLEAAEVDGATEWGIFWKIVMPIVKPAWLTLMIFSVQQLWREFGTRFIYTEQLKTLPYALNQIIWGGLARQGVAYAVMLLMASVPIIIFLINQSKVVETMSTSGLD